MIDTVATTLGVGLFGDSLQIQSDLLALHTGLERMLEHHTGISIPPVGEDLLLARALRRCALNEAFKALIQRQAPIEAYDVLSRLVQEIVLAGPEYQADVVAGSYALARNWQAHSGGRRLQALVRHDLAPMKVGIEDADEYVAQQMRPGIQLLTSALGSLAQANLSHVGGALLLSKNAAIESAFLVPLATVSVLNTNIAGDPAAVAEAALHESCHQKFYDLIATRRLVHGNYSFVSGPQFGVPWRPVNGMRRTMDALRVLSALHVYVHLLTLLLALHALEPQEMPLQLKVEDYWSRASFFSGLASSGALGIGLDADGKDMVTWLTSLMAQLGEDAVAHGARLHEPYRADAVEQAQRVFA